MRIRAFLFVLAALFAGGGVLAGKDPKDDKGPAQSDTSKLPAAGSKENDANRVEVRFVNGSMVVVALHESKIEVQTDYGKLSIPPADIRSIEFGVHLSPEVQEKIGECIRKLSSESYRDRETAFQNLISHGPHAYFILRRLKQPKEPEALRRVQLALAEIEKKTPKKVLRVKDDDRISTTKFTIVGKILTPIIRGQAEYFGDLNLRPSQLLSMRRMTDSRGTDVVVEAGKYALANKWLDTGIKVETGSGMKFTARGQVDLWPQQPGQYLTGPGGMAMNNFGGGIVIRGGGAMAIQQASGGALMGRIGPSGTPFVIGDQAVTRADQEGKLYLHIIPSPWGLASGSYNVRIETGAQPFDEDD